jgi:hypothetical protein
MKMMFSQRLPFRGFVRREDLAAAFNCEDRTDDNANKEEKALVRERGVEGEQGKGYVGERPRAALAECEQDDSCDYQKHQRAIEALEINAAPLVDYSDVELLTEHEIERIDHEPPAIWVEKKRCEAGGADDK